MNEKQNAKTFFEICNYRLSRKKNPTKRSSNRYFTRNCASGIRASGGLPVDARSYSVR